MGSIVPKYLFYFQDIDSDNHSLTRLKYDVDGWKSYGVTFGRETGISNVVKSYTQGWVFIKEDARYLKEKLLNYGPNRRIRLIVKRLVDALAGTYEVEYTGYVDLTQMSWDADTATAPVSEGGFFKALENSWDREYTIPNEAVCDFTGSVLDVDCETTTTDECSAGVPVSSTIGYFVVGGSLQNTDNGQDNIFQNVQPRAPVGDEDVHKSGLVRQRRRVAHELPADQRLAGDGQRRGDRESAYQGQPVS